MEKDSSLENKLNSNNLMEDSPKNEFFEGDEDQLQTLFMSSSK